MTSCPFPFTVAKPAALALLLGSMLLAELPAQQAQFVAIPGRSTVPGSNPNFTGISGTTGYSGVRVSANGRVVATVVYTPGFINGAVPRQAARWTEATGTVVLTGDLNGLYPVVGVSADGSAVYGEDWRWRANGGYQDLRPALTPGFFQSRILFGCSYDGLTVTGVDGIYPSTGDLFAWAIDTAPAPQLLPRAAAFPDGYYYFNAISGDGNVVGGSTRRLTTSPFASDTYAGVVVTPSGANVITPEGSQAGVNSLTVDGSVAVGYLTENARVRSFRWDAVGGLVLLDGSLPSANSSFARAISGDGSIVVGDYLNFGQPGTRAYTWTASRGFVDLYDDLVANYGLGAQLAGWQLLAATDVSFDGLAIVGQGINPNGVEQAFLVRMPSVPANAVAYGPTCVGPAGPIALVPDNLPYIGTTYTAVCSGVGATALPFGVLGFAPTATPLPSVSPLGLPGCELLTTPVASVLLRAVAGRATMRLTIPASPSLTGTSLRQQVVLFEPGNGVVAPSLASSNGLGLRVGAF